MANLTLRIPKAAPLTTAEVDNNFINLNNDTLLSAKNSTPWVASTSFLQGKILNVADRFYTVTVGGVTGTVAPSHTGGTIANGSTQLTFTALTNYDARDVLNKLLTVDGSGSGLDADTVDGLNTASANTVSTIVARDSSGNFSAGTITATLNGTASESELLNGKTSEQILGDALSSAISLSIALG